MKTEVINMRTRDEHIDWCKQRARERCERGDMLGALHSMGRDLTKHKDTKGHPWIHLWLSAVTPHKISSKADVLKFIDDYR